MAKKDTQKKYQEILERRKKADEELKEMKKLMAKEEREERKKCYIEMGKSIESCLSRNFTEDDIALFDAFVRENEDLIISIFEKPEETPDTENNTENEDPAEVNADPLPFES